MRVRSKPADVAVRVTDFGIARDLEIVYRDPETLKLRTRNPRTHSPKQLQQIANSIKEFGFITPVLIDETGTIIAGHGRVMAARQVGMSDIPTVSVDHLSAAQIRAYVIADNRLAENAGWDRQLLALELQELSVELNFDVTTIGFETAEADIIIGELAAERDEEDEVPDVDRSMPAVSRLGDLWQISDHFLLCGDALKAESYSRLLGGKMAQLVFTDPPYNVPIAGHVSGLGKIKHREFAMASGEMTQDAFTQFLRTVFDRLVDASDNGSIHFICMDWRHMQEVLAAAEKLYGELKNLCVWIKNNGGMGSLYRSQHELVFVFKNGAGAHINNVELGRFGRNRTNVWTYAGVNTFGKDRETELAMHPTVKPIALVSDAIMDCSKRGGIVLDAFAGSGTTLIAAEKTGRRGYGLEIDPHYVDTIIRRFVDNHGLTAHLVGTDKTFDEIQTERLNWESKDASKKRKAAKPSRQGRKR